MLEAHLPAKSQIVVDDADPLRYGFSVGDVWPGVLEELLAAFRGIDRSWRHSPDERVVVLTRSTRRRRTAVCIAIFSLGLMTSTWVTRTPAIRDEVRASTAQMGLLLFGISVGAKVGVLAARSLVLRYGPRLIAAFGVTLATGGVLGVALGSTIGSARTACMGFGLFGLGMGFSDIALNISAASIEAATGTHVLPALHGSCSLGTVTGAWLGNRRFGGRDARMDPSRLRRRDRLVVDDRNDLLGAV